MKKRLSIVAIILAINEVLTPFSFALEDGADIFGIEENIVIEIKNTEDFVVDDVKGGENEIDRGLIIDVQDDENKVLEGEIGSEEDFSEQVFEEKNHKIQEKETIIEIVEEEVRHVAEVAEEGVKHVVEVAEEEVRHEIEVAEEGVKHVVEEVEEEVEHVVEVAEEEVNHEIELVEEGVEHIVEVAEEVEHMVEVVEEELEEEVEYIITKIRYFFKRSGDDRYIKYGRDKNNIGTITLKDPQNGASITIMDKNLGADSVGIGRNSYGYYFQWGNNHGVVNTSNRTTTKAVYEDSCYNHGYDGGGVFIVGSTDYWENGNHYNNLWGESKEYARQASCPAGYHVPTIKEWNQLISIWGKIHTQDESKENGTSVLRYSASYATKNIHTFKSAATLCEEGDIECVDEDKLSSIIEVLSSELKLPLAGSYDENGNFHEGLGVYWTATPKDGNKAGVFSVDAYIGGSEDETLLYKAQGHSIRCFQNVEKYVVEDIQDSSTSSQNDEKQIERQENETGSGFVDDAQNADIQTGAYSWDILEEPVVEPEQKICEEHYHLLNGECEIDTYTITWKNEDGTVIDTTQVVYGEMPTHVDVSQPADIQYSYEFKGWSPEIVEAVGDAEYIATYTYIPKKYTITWKNEDGSVRDVTQVAYGEIPTHEDASQPSDDQYVYEFVGWIPEISKVIGDAEYVAKYRYIAVNSEEESLEGQGEIEEHGTDSETFDGVQDEENQENKGQQDEEILDGAQCTLPSGSSSLDNEIQEGEEQAGVEEQDNEEEGEEQGFWEGVWETLKSFFLEEEDGYLKGSETVDDVIITVEAEKGTFPEGTEVVIRGVPQERLEAIQTSLIEDETNNVKEDAQILAFDISFVYSGEEIQPEKEVSVKFNYKENLDFQGVKASEVSVYHIDDETDEGIEVDIVNKDGDEIEILATSFSTYAVVAQKGLRNSPVSGRGIMDQMSDFEFTGIVVSRPISLSGSHRDSPAKYVVMDRNLGATEPGRGESSYGYRYQYGNNYGFEGEQGNTAVLRIEANVNLTQYSNSNPYFSGVYVLGKDNSGTTSPDWATTSNNDIWGGDAIKESERQGPCPSGWHIPTASEWSDVIDYWSGQNGGMNISNFVNSLKLPFPGSLSRSAGNYYQTSYGNEGDYWSTSTSDSTSQPTYILKITLSSQNSYITENRANGFSIRCFKDDDTVYTVTYNDGINDDEVFVDQSGTGMRGDYFPSFVGGIPEWDGEGNRNFIGWYMEKNGEYVYVDPLNRQITSDVTLYAKWSACAEGECIVPPDEILVAHDMDVYFAVNSGNTNHYTLMDRNLGAAEPGTGSNSYGDLFQWGNNYGFSNTGYLPSKTTQPVNASQNGPGNYYYSSTFIYNNNGNDWSSPKNDNLWGDITSTSAARQGPCPDGYHVPSSGEWLSLYNSWYSVNGTAICSSISNCIEKIKNDLLLPAVGRISEKAQIGLQDAASYWSSSYSSTAKKAYGFYLRAADKEKQIQPNNEDYRTRARSLRCVKNIENTPLTINLNGGVLGSVSIYGGKLHYLTNPTKTGFDFAGWYTNSVLTTKIEDKSSIGNSTTVLYAKWMVEGEVEYTFNANGGIFEIEESGDIIETETFVQTYIQGDSFVLSGIQEPTRECYTFSGWYDAVNGGNLISFPSIIGDSITAYAHWDTGTCEIYTGVVGSGDVTITASEGYEYGKIVTFNANANSGYGFEKWELNGEDVLSGGGLRTGLQLQISLTGSVYLTGYFILSETGAVNSYRVYLSGDAGIGYFEINGERVEQAVWESGSEVPVNAVPKPGYHFVRWDKEERIEEKKREDLLGG